MVSRSLAHCEGSIRTANCSAIVKERVTPTKILLQIQTHRKKGSDAPVCFFCCCSSFVFIIIAKFWPVSLNLKTFFTVNAANTFHCECCKTRPIFYFIFVARVFFFCNNSPSFGPFLSILTLFDCKCCKHDPTLTKGSETPVCFAVQPSRFRGYWGRTTWS